MIVAVTGAEVLVPFVAVTVSRTGKVVVAGAVNDTVTELAFTGVVVMTTAGAPLPTWVTVNVSGSALGSVPETVKSTGAPVRAERGAGLFTTGIPAGAVTVNVAVAAADTKVQAFEAVSDTVTVRLGSPGFKVGAVYVGAAIVGKSIVPALGAVPALAAHRRVTGAVPVLLPESPTVAPEATDNGVAPMLGAALKQPATGRTSLGHGSSVPATTPVTDE